MISLATGAIKFYNQIMLLSARFCGNCNPREDMVQTYERIKSSLPGESFCFYADNKDADVFLYLSGCESSCLYKTLASSPYRNVPVLKVRRGLSEIRTFLDSLKNASPRPRGVIIIGPGTV